MQKETAEKEKMKKLKEINEEYLKLLSEYDSIVSDLIKERDTFKSEKDLVEKHLANLESAFADVHTKFVRAKSVVDGFKMNEEVLVETLNGNEISIKELQRRYDALKENTEMQFQDANKIFNKMKDEHENELKRKNTQIKRQEIIINSLQHCLQQKDIENEKLSMICDDFIYNQDEIL
ncbi:transforming acidic coiled-coil protein [Carabus blaptoides fortunei]